MEVTTLVAEPALSSREFAEVARGHWTDIIVELEDDSSGGLGVDGDVKLQAKQRQAEKKNECGCWVKTYENITEEGRKGGLSAVE